MIGTSEKRSQEGEEFGQKIKAVVLDIEGTTTSISFVKDTLFPYVRENLNVYLKNHWTEPEFVEDLTLLRKQAENDKEAGVEGLVPIPAGSDNYDEICEAVLNNIIWQMDLDRKTKALKQFQGHVMREGYLNGKLKGHVYDDVQPALKSWTHSGRQVYVYSSGSVAAQKLLFGHSVKGDLLEFFSGHFDTEIGPKMESSSYSNIAKQLNCESDGIMFLTDIPKEAMAAREAGLHAILVSRPGNDPLSDEDSHKFQVIKSFDDIVFEVSAKRTKLSVDEEPQTESVPDKLAKDPASDAKMDVDDEDNSKVREAETTPGPKSEDLTMKESGDTKQLEDEKSESKRIDSEQAQVSVAGEDNRTVTEPEKCTGSTEVKDLDNVSVEKSEKEQVNSDLEEKKNIVEKNFEEKTPTDSKDETSKAVENENKSPDEKKELIDKEKEKHTEDKIEGASEEHAKTANSVKVSDVKTAVTSDTDVKAAEAVKAETKTAESEKTVETIETEKTEAVEVKGTEVKTAEATNGETKTANISEGEKKAVEASEKTPVDTVSETKTENETSEKTEIHEDQKTADKKDSKTEANDEETVKSKNESAEKGKTEKANGDESNEEKEKIPQVVNDIPKNNEAAKLEILKPTHTSEEAVAKPSTESKDKAQDDKVNKGDTPISEEVSHSNEETKSKLTEETKVKKLESQSTEVKESKENAPSSSDEVTTHTEKVNETASPAEDNKSTKSSNPSEGTPADVSTKPEEVGNACDKPDVKNKNSPSKLSEKEADGVDTEKSQEKMVTENSEKDSSVVNDENIVKNGETDADMDVTESSNSKESQAEKEIENKVPTNVKDCENTPTDSSVKNVEAMETDGQDNQDVEMEVDGNEKSENGDTKANGIKNSTSDDNCETSGKKIETGKENLKLKTTTEESDSAKLTTPSTVES